MSKLQAGAVVILQVIRKMDTGYVLSDGKNEILLHTNETERDLDVHEEVEVFLYHDKKGQLIATMSIPTVQFDTYEWVEVVDVVKNLGVFVDIGIQKEMLVSKDHLPLIEGVWPQSGDELFVTLSIDHKGRLLAEPITEEIVENERKDAVDKSKNESIGGRVYRSTKVGSFIITEEGYRGFIHHTERKREPRLGEWVEGRIIEVKNDGTLNVSLLPLKQEGMSEDAENILAYMNKNSGEMHFHDKSDPDEIRNEFHISKAAFKRALGKLLKEKKVAQIDGKIVLFEQGSEDK